MGSQTQSKISKQLENLYQKPILLALVLILFFLAGYALPYVIERVKISYKTATTPTIQTVTPKPTQPQPTILPTESATEEFSRWKTYTDKKNGFEFKYPQEWDIGKSTLDKSMMAQSGIDDIIGFLGKTSPFNFWFHTYLLSRGETINDLVNRENLKDSLTSHSQVVSQVARFEETHEHPNYKVMEPSIWSSAQGAFIRFIIAPSQDKIILFGLDPFNEGGTPIANIEVDKQQKDIYFKILSTFKFTDQNQQANTKNWQSYTSSEGKYSINYPSDWILEVYKEKHPYDVSYDKGSIEFQTRTTTAQEKASDAPGRPIDMGSGLIKIITSESLGGPKLPKKTESEFFNLGTDFWFQGNVGGGGGTTFLTPTEVVVDGKRTVKQTSHPTTTYEWTTPHQITIQYYVWLGNNEHEIAQIEFRYDDQNPNKDQIIGIFNQMVASFKISK